MKKFYSEPELMVKKFYGVDILTGSYTDGENTDENENPDLNNDDNFDIFSN